MSGADGIELDVHGNFFVNVITQNTILRIAAETLEISTLADASDGLDFPSTAVVGTGHGERTTLSPRQLLGWASLLRFPYRWPRLLRVETGVIGLPQP